MAFEEIEQLLERYWQCQTTVEEEAKLRRFFNGADVPAHLERYRDWFRYQQAEQGIRLGEEFDRRLLAQVEAPVVKARRVTALSRLMPLFRAAAAVAVLLLLGNVMQHSFLPDNEDAVAADTIGQQISAPSVALSGDKAASTHERQEADSLERVRRETQEFKR